MQEEGTAQLAAALVLAQTEMPKVEPDKVNPHFKNKYVTLDHLIALTRPVLNKHGLAIVQMPSIGPAGEMALTTTLVHTSGETWSQQMLLAIEKSGPQGQGAALTYARRYAWAACLGISSDEDDDGERAASSAARAARADTPTDAARAPSRGSRQTPDTPATPDAPPPAPKPITAATVDAITASVDALQQDFGNHESGLSWSEQMDVKVAEWFDGKKLAELTTGEADLLVRRIETTRKKLSENLSAA